MTLARSLLWPFSAIYGAGVWLRVWSYSVGLARQRRLAGAVISVGNLTVGGTGKTPMVCWLAERALAEGKRVGILSRGYRGSAGSSDETELLKKRLGSAVRFGIGGDRYARGRELEAAGVDWFILDDGFQHLQLARDLEIVLIDATNPFGGGRLLPAGRLREPISALRRADVMVITRSFHAPAVETLIRRHTQAPIFYAQTKLDAIGDMAEKVGNQAAAKNSFGWRGKKLFAFCGIGNPGAFLADLHRWDAEVVGHMEFRDHHVYSQRDVDEIQRRARAVGADALVCTEKDLPNLRQTRRAALPLLYCTISLQINDPEAFWNIANSTIRARRSGAKR